MKKQTLHVTKLMLLTLFTVLIYGTSQAQCSSPDYQDLIEWVQGTDHALEAQITIINAASADDGTHYYTAWGSGTLMFTGAPSATSRFPCQFTTPDYFKLLYSDRTKAYIEKSEQPFSAVQTDEQSISIDIVNNVIISESKTWQFSVTYNNLVRNGDILYASSNGSMIIINLHKITSPIIRMRR